MGCDAPVAPQRSHFGDQCGHAVGDHAAANEDSAALRGHIGDALFQAAVSFRIEFNGTPRRFPQARPDLCFDILAKPLETDDERQRRCRQIDEFSRYRV